jgi:hypothetical protein
MALVSGSGVLAALVAGGVVAAVDCADGAVAVTPEVVDCRVCAVWATVVIPVVWAVGTTVGLAIDKVTGAGVVFPVGADVDGVVVGCAVVAEVEGIVEATVVS